MPKKHLPRRGTRGAHLAITNPMTSAYMDDATIRVNVARFMANASGRDLKLHLPRLFANLRTRGAYGGNATTLKEISSAKYYVLDQPRLFQLYTSLIDTHRDQLVHFCVARRRFESAVIFGDYVEAENRMAAIREQFGESLWLIRSNILLLHLQQKSVEMEEYSRSCRLALNQTIAAYLVNAALIVTANPALHLNKTVRATMKEFAKANHAAWADLLALSLLPQEPQNDASPLLCLQPIQVLPIVDQIVFLRSLLSHNEALTSAANPDSQAQRLLQLLNTIDSEARYQYTAPRVGINEQLREYEQGNYETFLDLAYSNLTFQWRPVALANLIAKAHAILDRPVTSDSLFGSYISSLADLYRLSPHPHTTENEASEVIAILNHFSDSYDLQFGLVKAMPHRFSTKSRCWTAKRNYLYYDDHSPWSGALASPSDPVLSHRYQSDSAALTPARRHKQNIQSLLEEDIDPSIRRVRLMTLLRAFGDEAPLARDYLELTSSALLAIGDFEQLISKAAKALAESPGSYTAIQLRAIAAYIEANSIATLDAVVVLYFYAKRVDKSKEYLLNDLYEEFLVSNGATKPSDLIADFKEDHDARFCLFLSEISTLEMMDSLDCFEGSSDLSAERIRILDYLRDRGEISTESHGAQVDEIVTKVVVDNTAAEFSVAKIDVDDDAIRRDIHTDVAGLVAIYNALPVEQADRIIQIQEDSATGAETVPVVIGDKGTTLEKIVGLVVDSFVNDEKYGLARNLSAEIRHGFFANQMRARLEEAHLLTELGADGVYLPNRYWLEKYDFIADELTADIDRQLGWFSEQFNKLVEEAEEWMKVATLPSQSATRAFRFDEISLGERQLVRTAVATGDTDQVLATTFQILWHKTDCALADVRQRIDTHLRERVDRLLNELFERVETSRRGAPLIDLMDALYAARGRLHEDITTISEWFQRASAVEAHERTIPELVRISVECLNRVRGSQLSPTLDVPTEIGRSLRATRHVRAFIIANVNLLENALRHSGLGVGTEIAIHATGNSATWSLTVRNNLTNERAEALDAVALEEIRKKFAGNQSAGLTLTEGGSGLRKVVNHLKSIHDHFNLSIDKIDTQFVATVTYDYDPAC
jgi:hypothetical protein